MWIVNAQRANQRKRANEKAGKREKLSFEFFLNVNAVQLGIVCGKCTHFRSQNSMQMKSHTYVVLVQAMGVDGSTRCMHEFGWMIWCQRLSEHFFFIAAIATHFDRYAYDCCLYARQMYKIHFICNTHITVAWARYQHAVYRECNSSFCVDKDCISSWQTTSTTLLRVYAAVRK